MEVRTQPTLLQRLTVEQRGPNLFAGDTFLLPGAPRLFGGEVVARALAAAQETVPPELGVHSLHAHFLLGGVSGSPLRLRVERVRDGRSFTTRQVAVVQEDRVILTLTASFHRNEPGPEAPTPFPTGVPSPEEAVHRPTPLDDYPGSAPFEIVELLPFSGHGPGQVQRRVWIRAREPLPTEPAVHIRALAYLTDINTAFVPLHASGVDPSALSMLASLDHALWVHRTPRADEWMLMEMSCPAVGGARGLTTGTVHACDGTHLATFVQESLLRMRTGASHDVS